MVVGPTLLARHYYFDVAADRFVTEFRYSVRGGAAMPDASDSGGVIGAASSLVFAGDSYILEDYLQSAQAVVDVAARLPLDTMLALDGDDPVRQYVPGSSAEEMLRYWLDAVSVNFDAVTGISTVRVSLFTAEDAYAVARSLVETLDQIVNSLSANARREALAYVDETFRQSEATLAQARMAIAEFRRENRIVSPTEQAEIGSEIISTLSNDLAQFRVRLRSLRQQAPASPQIAMLEEKIDSVEEQLVVEFDLRGGGAGEEAALPNQLSDYEELENAYQIARDTYVNTADLMHRARADMVLREAQLVVFVPPRQPFHASEPKRVTETMIVFGIVFMAWLMLRILLAGLRTQ